MLWCAFVLMFKCAKLLLQGNINSNHLFGPNGPNQNEDKAKTQIIGFCFFKVFSYLKTAILSGGRYKIRIYIHLPSLSMVWTIAIAFPKQTHFHTTCAHSPKSKSCRNQTHCICIYSLVSLVQICNV